MRSGPTSGCLGLRLPADGCRSGLQDFALVYMPTPSSLIPGLTFLYPLGPCSLYSGVYFLEYSFYFSGLGMLQVFLMGIPLFS